MRAPLRWAVRVGLGLVAVSACGPLTTAPTALCEDDPSCDQTAVDSGTPIEEDATLDGGAVLDGAARDAGRDAPDATVVEDAGRPPSDATVDSTAPMGDAAIDSGAAIDAGSGDAGVSASDAAVTPATNGVRDGTETDIDCGGGAAPRCGPSQGCAADSDCSGGGCVANRCEVARSKTSLALGASSSCAVLDDGTVKCWGSNVYGQLGLGDTVTRGNTVGQMGDALPAVDLGMAARAISVGYRHACAILVDDTVKCWGGNEQAQLGLGDLRNRGDGPNEMGAQLPRVDLGPGAKVAAVSAGAYHTCALLVDGRLKCWGTNAYGQLGLGTTESHGHAAGTMGTQLAAVDFGGRRRPVQVTVGQWSTCARTHDGAVACFGVNGDGQLGIGTRTSRGGAPGDMGNGTAYVDFGNGRRATSVAFGSSHVCAVLDDGTARCWGKNVYGELGLGDQVSRGGTPATSVASLPPIDLGSAQPVVAISPRVNHTCALLGDGAVRCWGMGTDGNLGNESTLTRGDEPGEMGAALPPTLLSGNARATYLANGPGGLFSCALLPSGVKCWGLASYGALGLGDSRDRGNVAGQMGDNLPFVSLSSSRPIATP